MDEVEAVELAFHQAGGTVNTYLVEAIESIDRHFGEGYAQEHPELVGSFIVACTQDVQAMLLFRVLKELSRSLGDIHEALDGLRPEI